MSLANPRDIFVHLYVACAMQVVLNGPVTSQPSQHLGVLWLCSFRNLCKYCS
jgi:hypothetical protein